MTVFSKVVTGVKRRIPASDVAYASEVTRRVKDVAPDLRRFSDFMNPFPTVSPGGYTKYYKARGGEDPSTSQYALPPLCELNQRPPAPRRPAQIQSSGLSKPRSSRQVTPASSTLTPIPELSSELHSHKPRTPSQRSSPHASLRRRKGRLLRTPSVERDFSQHTILDSQSTLDRSASTSSSQSSSTFKSRSSPHSSNSSSDSHSSTQSSSFDSPHTPVDTMVVPLRVYLLEDPFHRQKKSETDWEPYERPDSRSTYRTARTHFDDI